MENCPFVNVGNLKAHNHVFAHAQNLIFGQSVANSKMWEHKRETPSNQKGAISVTVCGLHV